MFGSKLNDRNVHVMWYAIWEALSILILRFCWSVFVFYYFYLLLFKVETMTIKEMRQQLRAD